VGFSLRKWYFDCVSEDGDAVIAYRAELRWEAVALQYASFLHAPPGTAPRVRSTLRRCPAPSVEADLVRWDAAPLEISGTWERAAPAFSTELLRGPAGDVLWRCEQPRGRARIRLPSGHAVEGFGYVEELSLTLPPWRMPIDELRWGRFTSAGAGLTWIEWRGPHPLRLALLDGRGVELSSADEARVEVGRASLALSDKRTLRSGRIGATVLSIIPGLERIFPLRVLGLEETKWLSRASLGPCSGWAIHEVVRWPP
jgi:hypothetical protein